MKLYGEVEVKNITKIVVDGKFVFERYTKDKSIYWKYEGASYTPEEVMKFVNSHLSEQYESMGNPHTYLYHAWISDHTLNISKSKKVDDILQNILQKQQRCKDFEKSIRTLFEDIFRTILNSVAEQTKTNSGNIKILHEDTTSPHSKIHVAQGDNT